MEMQLKGSTAEQAFRAAPVNQRSAHTAVYLKAVAQSLVGAGALVWGLPPFLVYMHSASVSLGNKVGK